MSTAAELVPSSDVSNRDASKSIITLNHFKHALRVVSAAVSSRAVIPILAGIRIEQLAAGLAVEATCLDIYIRALVPELSGPAKTLVVPADKLTAWVKLLVGEDVKISTTAARATMVCGRSRAVLPALNATAWPDNSILQTKGDGITLKQGDLARALRFTVITASTDSSRPALNGVMLEGDGTTLNLVATNGHCMMVYSSPCVEKIRLLLPLILIKAALPLLAGTEDGVDLNYDSQRIMASIAGETPVFVATPKNLGTFPNWQTVMPKGERTEVTVNATALLAALERCALLADERSGLVVFDFNLQITLTSASAESGESQETVDCVGAPKEPVRVGVNSEYVINLLKRLDGDVTIALPNGDVSPLMFKAKPAEGETLTYIIMPMRV